MAIAKHSLPTAPFVTGLQAPVEDPRYGAQYGWSTDIQNYLSQAPYTSGQVFYVMLRGPEGYALLNDGGIMMGTLKSLLELGSHRIEGLRRSLQPSVNQYEIGGAGHEFHYHSDVKEDQSEVTHVMYDRNNGCVSRFWEFHYRTFIMDQKTKAPMIITMGQRPDKILPSFYSWAGIYIEPDITQTKAVDAIMILNQSPKTMPTVELRRDLGAGREVREISITTTGFQDTSFGTLAIAQMILDTINYTGANPQMQPAPLDDIEADVARHAGYLDGIDTMSKAAINP